MVIVNRELFRVRREGIGILLSWSGRPHLCTDSRHPSLPSSIRSVPYCTIPNHAVPYHTIPYRIFLYNWNSFSMAGRGDSFGRRHQCTDSREPSLPFSIRSVPYRVIRIPFPWSEEVNTFDDCSCPQIVDNPPLLYPFGTIPYHTLSLESFFHGRKR